MGGKLEARNGARVVVCRFESVLLVRFQVVL